MNLSFTSSNISSILPESTETESTNECAITFYSGEDLTGGSITISNSGTNIEIEEQSAETSGNCCWRVYRLDRKERRFDICNIFRL